MPLYTVRDNSQQTDALAKYLPDYNIFRSKFIADDTLRRFLMGLAYEFARVENKINEVYDEIDPRQTTALITEWERLLGIPDACFPLASTLAERRDNILFKLSSSMTGTKQDFVDLAAILGFTVEIADGISAITFPLTFPILMIGSVEEAAFTMVVTFVGVSVPSSFPYTFPFTFTEDPTIAVRCLFDRLIPANVQVIYLYD